MIQVTGYHSLALGTVKAHMEAKHIPQIVYNSAINKDTIEGYSMESMNKQ